MCFGEKRQKMWSSYRCSCGMIGLQALGHLRNAFLRLSLLCQRPAAHDSTMRYPERKSLFLGEDDGGFGAFLRAMHLAAILMAHSSPAQGKTEAKRMCTLLRQRHCLVAPRQRLVRRAKCPQRQSGVD